jgi:hypothetical protein
MTLPRHAPHFNALVVALMWSVAATSSTIGGREAIYVGGNVNLAYQRGNTKSFRPGNYGVQVSGQIDTSSESELVFDAGHRGALVIPYGAIISFEYYPVYSGNAYPHQRYPYRMREPPYPWSGSYHTAEAEHFHLRLELLNEGGRPGAWHGALAEVIFELGQDIVRPTIEALERRTGLSVALTSVAACAAYKGREACGWGAASELKGRTRVFIDTRVFMDRNESIETEDDLSSYENIVAVIEEARLGITVVKSAEDADIILAFRFFSATFGISGFGGTGSTPSAAIGEVYIAEGGRLRVLMLFEKERFPFFTRKLSRTFGLDFVKAYKDANGIK